MLGIASKAIPLCDPTRCRLPERRRHEDGESACEFSVTARMSASSGVVATPALRMQVRRADLPYDADRRNPDIEREISHPQRLAEKAKAIENSACHRRPNGGLIDDRRVNLPGIDDRHHVPFHDFADTVQNGFFQRVARSHAVGSFEKEGHQVHGQQDGLALQGESLVPPHGRPGDGRLAHKGIAFRLVAIRLESSK